MRNHQRRTADLGQREVDLPLTIIEQAQVRDFIRYVAGIVFRVTLGDPDQNQQSVPDLANRFALDRNLRFGHSLNYRPHRA